MPTARKYTVIPGQPGFFHLLPVSSTNPELAPTLSVSVQSYVDLVESTAEALQQQGIIKSADALVSLGIKPTGWMQAVKDFGRLFRTAVGSEKAIVDFMERTGRTRRPDASTRRLLFV